MKWFLVQIVKNFDCTFFENKSYILNSLTDMCYKKYLNWIEANSVYDRGTGKQAISSAKNDDNEKRKVQIWLLFQILKHTGINLLH